MPGKISLEKKARSGYSSPSVKPNEDKPERLRDLGFLELRGKRYSSAYNYFNRLLKINNDDFLANLGLAIVYSYNFRIDNQNKTKEHTCNKQWDRLTPMISKVTQTEKELIRENCLGVTVGFDMDIFTFVALSCCKDMIELFLKCGFDPCTEYGGKSILHRIVNGSDSLPNRSCERIKLLLDFGANPYVQTEEGESLINSKTPKTHVKIIQERYLNLQSKDITPVSETTHNLQSGNIAIGCFAVIILIYLILLVASAIPRFDYSSYQALYSHHSDGDRVECIGCGKGTYYTRWNRGYCSDCHQGTHTCAAEGCKVEIPDYSWIEYCIAHDKD